MGLALAASDPHRYQDWVYAWQEDQQRRLALVEWQLDHLAEHQPEGLDQQGA